MSEERERLARELYQALIAGDRAALDELLHPDFEGEVTDGLPRGMGGRHSGPDAMRRRVWGRLGRLFDIDIQPEEFHPLDDGRLLVIGHYVGTARETGGKLDAAFTHVIAFADGRIARIRQLTDSQRFVQALQAPAPAAAGGLVLSTVEFEIVDGLGHLRLNRPEVGNAINPAMPADLYEVAMRCSGADGLRALLITGNGDRFCVGGDIQAFADAGPREMGAVMASMTRRFHPALALLSELPVPIVCAVQGAAAGGGLGLTYVADLVLAAEGTKFALGFAGIGVSGDGGASWFLPRLVGPRRAAELYLEERVLTAEEARDWGLVTRVVPAGELHEQALAVARRLASGPTVAYGEIRGLLRQTWRSSLPEQLAAETSALGRAGATADAEGAVAAFLTKERPSYRGK